MEGDSTMREIPLTRGQIALVDDEDFERIVQYKWFAEFHHGRWQACHNLWVNHKVKKLRMHRLIIGLDFGDKRQCDHKDLNSLNNQKNNLRITNFFGNAQNRPKISPTKKYKGVYYCGFKNQLNPWQARICIGGRNNKQDINLGYYPTQEDAARAYNEAAKHYHGEFARLNIIPENSYASHNAIKRS